MTTAATTPDGATPNNAPTPDPNAGNPAGGEGAGALGQEPWRNVEDAKKAFAQRDKFKEERDAALQQIEAIKASGTANADALAELQKRVDDDDLKKAIAGGNAEALVELFTTKLAEKDTALAKFKAAGEEQGRLDRRRETADAILKGAHPEHVETVRLMLSGLHDSKDIDLYAEKPDEEAARAVPKLSKRFPQYFRPSDGTSQGGLQAGAHRDLSGVDWGDLTPEEQALVTDEQFEKNFSRGSKGGGGGMFG